MSRLRFGNKHKGGVFAHQFKEGLSKGMPMYKVAPDGPAFMSAIKKMQDLLKKKAEETRNKATDDASGATKEAMGIEDVVPKKVGSASRRMSRADFFNKSADQVEDYMRELREKQEQEAEEAEQLAYDREKGHFADDGSVVFHNDYDAHGGKGSWGDRRREKKQNKQQIKERYANGEISKAEYKRLKKENRQLNRKTFIKNTGKKIKGAAKKIGGAFKKLFRSDARLKENIEFIGYSEEGFKVYEFDYINKEHGKHRYRGLIAQDLVGLELTKPDYKGIVTREKGSLMVDYSFTDVEMEIVEERSDNEN